MINTNLRKMFKVLLLFGIIFPTPTYSSGAVDMKAAIKKYITNNVIGIRKKPGSSPLC